MNSLSEENKQQFEQQIKGISTRDESRVMREIGQEIDKLTALNERRKSSKIEGLISNAQFLYKVLSDKDFPLPESTRKWIVFGLGYLISDMDLIPDMIPVIGYNDDAMVLQWVMYMIDYDLERYRQFDKMRQLSIEGSHFNRILQGKGSTQVVLFPGFLTDSDTPDEIKHWTTKIRGGQGIFRDAGISVVTHSMRHLKEFSTVVRIVDHELSLKPSYNHELFESEWQQIKQEYYWLGLSLARELAAFKAKNQQSEMVVIALNVGAIAAEAALEHLKAGSVSRYYSMGSAASHNTTPKRAYEGLNRVYNYYSSNDHALQFIFDNMEWEDKPLGCQPFINPRQTNVDNINISEKLKSHHDYKYLISELLKI